MNAGPRCAPTSHYRTSIPASMRSATSIAGPMLAHKAEDEGVAVAEIHGRPGRPCELRRHPERRLYQPGSRIGRPHRRKRLKADGVEYVAGKFPFSANGRARAMLQTEGFVKVLADKKDRPSAGRGSTLSASPPAR